LGKEIVDRVRGIAAMGHFFQWRQMLVSAAARIVELNALVIADVRNVAGIEESAVVGELGKLSTIPKAPRPVTDIAADGEGVARRERLLERIDGVDVARCRTHKMEGPVETDICDRLHLIGEVNLRDR